MGLVFFAPIWKGISRAESPISWYGSICNISDTELAGGNFADLTNLLRENKAVRRSYYNQTSPGSLRRDFSNGLRRLSNISSDRYSRRSFVQLDDGELEKVVVQDPIIPKRCFIRKESADACATVKRASQLNRHTITEDIWRPRAKRNSGLSFRQRKHEDEMLRRRLTQIDVGSFTDIDLKEKEERAAAPATASGPYEFLPLRHVRTKAKERVEGWLSTDLGSEQHPARTGMTIAATLDGSTHHQSKDVVQDWYRSEHGKYAFRHPPRLVNQTERHAIRRKSVHFLTSYPPPPIERSSPWFQFQDDYYYFFNETEYIVKQRRLGKQILLILSTLPPIGWLVVAYIGFHGSRSDELMRWRSHGDVQEFHYKERRFARWLAMIQAVMLLVMVIVIPAAALG
ncbi:hypothetical protein KEM54_002027 [Ascosphaera aggregata]|nr:hypothetical protein KEM54_002027 [Ascosphaera aggregata]